ncbi:agmatinase [Planotetraspora sp. A-T 1434]|uniref:agmatinase n=1 Tax=Planotetraspora sp. A-T 1434 TaxID=2979219 RepID=UPI0021BF140D|nr:agmatinase [Planotetraspora sp. A-T 1434]MCT9929652.1 agmatinase [Planotetraspora sp. A-T 1434]
MTERKQSGNPGGLPSGLLAQLEAESYMGPATFGKQLFLTEPEQLDEWSPDVAVVGAPWDASTTYRPGARFGPRALRALTHVNGSYHLDLGIEIFDYLRVVDYGDALIRHGLWEPSAAAIRERVGEIASRGIMPVVLGGDHSITWPSATAVADARGHGSFGVIHFDAHADTADEIDGNLASHGTPMRRLIESGAVRGSNFVQVGLRGYWPPAETVQWMREQGMRTHFMHEIWERGANAVLDDVIAEALDGPAAVYLSVDIDVLDPGFAPGTGTPEPGGLAPVDLLRMVRRIAMETNVIAMDVVEVSPPYDVSDLTVNNAHRLVWEVLAGLAHKRRATGERPEGETTT